jgi:hypothetical protein
LFPEVHHPLRNGYVSVEELVKDNSHNKPGLFQPLSSFPLRGSFPRRGKITTLTNFPLLTTILGASCATLRRLGGKLPRVINASKLVDVKPKCSSYGNALVSSQGHS